MKRRVTVASKPGEDTLNIFISFKLKRIEHKNPKRQNVYITSNLQSD
jgi:hypothetical protein